MTKYYIKGKEFKLGEVLLQEDISIKIRLTQEFIDDNPALVEIKEDFNGYVKCLSWDGDSHTPGIIYPVVDGIIKNQDGSTQELPTNIHVFHTRFEHVSKKEYEDQQSKLTAIEDPIPEYIKIKINVKHGTGRWAASYPGKIFKVVKFDYWEGIEEKCYHVSKDTCIVIEDCVPATKDEYELQELLSYLNDNYKVGDVIKTSTAHPEIDKISSLKFPYVPNITEIWVSGEKYNIKLYSIKRGWSQIQEPLYVTPNNVKLYEDTICYHVNEKFEITKITMSNLLSSLPNVFESEYIAKDWVKRNKLKELSDYEHILMLNDDHADTDLDNDVWEMYAWLKRNEPKLYWTKVLQLIADDLNNDWKPNWNDTKEMKSKIQYYEDRVEIGSNYDYNDGVVYFKNRSNTSTAIKLMGDNLKFIFNV